MKENVELVLLIVCVLLMLVLLIDRIVFALGLYLV